ncbi:MAG: hypothetical protein GXP54_08700, partial [Deltaproteobacteria bacterium]|nr:hypothetical protein [Deltaproteobacteria bacterium]
MKSFSWTAMFLLAALAGCSSGSEGVNTDDSGPVIDAVDIIDSGNPDSGKPDTMAADESSPPAITFHGCDGPVDLDAVPKRQFIVAPYLILP